MLLFLSHFTSPDYGKITVNHALLLKCNRRQTDRVTLELLRYLFLLFLCEWEWERWRSLCLCFLSLSRSLSPSSRCRRERWEDVLPPSLKSTEKDIILSHYILVLHIQILFDRKLILTDIAHHFWIWEQQDKEKLEQIIMMKHR